jgi:type III restriction enzyme
VTASIGQLALEGQDEPLSFRMVMEKDWKETLVDEGIR